MDYENRITINTVANISGYLVISIFGFVLAPFLLHYLGKSTYGVWVLIGSAFTYANLLSLGLNSAVDRWIPIYVAKKRPSEVNYVISSAFFVYSFSALILALIVIILVIWFPLWFDIEDPSIQTTSRAAICIVGFGFVITLITNMFPATLSGFQRQDLIMFTEMLLVILRTLLIFVLLPLGYGLIFVASIFSSVAVGRAGILALLAHREFPNLRVSFALVRISLLRTMFGYSFNTFLFMCGELIRGQTALILVGILLGSAAVPEYSLPYLVTVLMSSIVLSLSKALKPATSHLQALERLTEIKNLYLKITKYALLFIIPSTVLILVYGKPFLEIWLGNNAAGINPNVLTALAIGAGIRVWHFPGFLIAMGMGYHRLFGLFTIGNGVTSVILSFLIFYIYDLGVLGIAIAFCLSDIVFSLVLMTPYCCRIIGISLRHELKYSFVPACCAMIPFLCTVLVFQFIWSPTSYLELFILGILLSVPFCIGCWIWGLTTDEKIRFWEILRFG